MAVGPDPVPRPLPAVGPGRLDARLLGAPGEFSTTLGASGAIFGLMGALLVLAVKVRGNIQQILVWIGVNIA